MTQQEQPSAEVTPDLPDGSVDQDGAALTLDERFEILKNERRRLVLEYLSSVDETVSLSTLADRIAAIENETTVDDVTSSERKRVYVALYQFHLPKMDRMGVVEYDQDRGNIELTAAGRTLYQEHETEQTAPRYLRVLDISACLLGAVVLLGVVITQAWFVGTVFLGIQTALLGARTVASHSL